MFEAIAAITTNSGFKEKFLGTGFLYHDKQHLITAKHVIIGAESGIQALFPYTKSIHPVTSLATHDELDIAILRLGPNISNHKTELENKFFSQIVPSREIGEDIVSHGYPEDIDISNNGIPTFRTFKGNIQRRFLRKNCSHSSNYKAYELSFQCPSGLSGAPVIRRNNQTELVGLVTENISVGKDLIKEEDGYLYKGYISYGVALDLMTVTEWLTAAINSE